ncbi:MAG: hypothetical protein BYD32DRAFT_437534 [Podila humilis]|nr:MAG: hypothetical protein BYD32DRAFT_437534 [Podila humilis]
MSSHIPTSWIQLVVQKTISRKKKDNTIAFKTFCTWDGHHITLEQDPATSADVAGQFTVSALADLKVGDRLQAKGLLVVNLQLDQHNLSVLKLCLRVHEIRTGNEQSVNLSGDSNRLTSTRSSGDSSTSNGSFNDESLSDGSSSDGSSGNQSSRKRRIVKRTKLEPEAQTGRADDRDNSHEKELKEIICDPRIQRSQSPSAKRKLPSKDSSDSHSLNSDSDGDNGNHDAGADDNFSSLVPLTGSHRDLIGLAGSTPRSFGHSTPQYGGYTRSACFTFNGRGQPTNYGRPLRELHQGNVAYCISQLFRDGSKRVIFISTQMKEDESIDTLVVTENVHYPHGLMAWSRQLN